MARATGGADEGRVMTAFTESVVEKAALAWLKAIGWQIAHGPDIAPDMPEAERANYGEVVLGARLRDALARLNPTLPAEALEEAYPKLTRPEGADLIQRNRALHRLMVNGVTVEYWRRAAWCSPPSTSSFPRRRAIGTRRSPIAATSW